MNVEILNAEAVEHLQAMLDFIAEHREWWEAGVEGADYEASWKSWWERCANTIVGQAQKQHLAMVGV